MSRLEIQAQAVAEALALRQAQLLAHTVNTWHLAGDPYTPADFYDPEDAATIAQVLLRTFADGAAAAGTRDLPESVTRRIGR